LLTEGGFGSQAAIFGSAATPVTLKCLWERKPRFACKVVSWLTGTELMHPSGLRGAFGLARPTVATLPFPLLTWRSLTIPAIGILLFVLGSAALRHLLPIRRGS
jgi:hypothetical protein